MLKLLALDAIGLAAAVCLGMAVYTWLGTGATWCYAAIVLFALWATLGPREDEHA